MFPRLGVPGDGCLPLPPAGIRNALASWQALLRRRAYEIRQREERKRKQFGPEELRRGTMSRDC
ncbi:hypothetical protein CTAM01_02871 [Colletotrichum tamarilloi]|uniref:Uncharacterized protein n=1 Tax=Colletotrichum tamarilloi TaxID=1209934 RepID=A0ABQ9RMM7_9PEZI|nr:uncharacterized protein CTAM01_02871 [Colletotrichum tamarilloi]KAK1507759.1 hypothetical protein CTAM01_02871 [Colletotrichum tamarilloi]